MEAAPGQFLADVMGFGVFIHRVDSIYRDSPAVQYQFPAQYLGRAQSCVGDWIVYYEPTKVPRSRGYYAVAKVETVVSDPEHRGMYLALIKPGSYLQFSSPVPFIIDGEPPEAGLLNERGRLSGRAQAAIRPLSPNDFRRIVSNGLAEVDGLLARDVDVEPEVEGFAETQVPFEVERERVDVLSSRLVRARVFRQVVLRAYDERCAVTGLRLINGGGRAEVEAAHIRSVESNGPDIVNNGLALSGTAHWMFDRGLISVSDDLEVMISRHVNDRTSVESLVNKSGRLIGPIEGRDQPHPAFLKWHRENTFKV